MQPAGGAATIDISAPLTVGTVPLEHVVPPGYSGKIANKIRTPIGSYAGKCSKTYRFLPCICLGLKL